MGMSRVTRKLALAAVAIVASGCVASTVSLRQELVTSNTQTVLAFEETIYNKHEIREGFEHYVGPIYREHDPRIGDGRDAAIRSLTQLVTRFPGSRLAIQRTLAQGNLVAVQLQWRAHAQGAHGFTRVDVYRLENERIVEHWDVTEEVPIDPARSNLGLGSSKEAGGDGRGG